MKAVSSEEALWADNMAARLRLLQASFADEDPASRQRFVAEELERVLRGVPDSRKKACLESLAERFPSWQAAVPAVVPGPEEAEGAETPEMLVIKLVSATAGLPETARQKIAQHLKEAGFALAGPKGAAMEGDLPQDTMAKLFLEPGKSLDAERACRLLATLLEWMLLLEQPAWKLWREVHPTATLRREGIPGGDLRSMIGKYLGGDTEVSTQQVAAVLQKSRRLIAGLMIALGSATRQYASHHYDRFSPAAIEDVARTEKKMMESVETACWRKYRELASASSVASIEKEIRDVIAKCAEEVMLGPKASA
jgi:hypothetical protein